MNRKNGNPTSTIVVQSMCHLHEGNWIPEEGSKQWTKLQKLPEVRQPMVDYSGVDKSKYIVVDLTSFREAGYKGERTKRYHWVEAICKSVVSSSRKDQNLILDQWTFNAQEIKYRCEACHEQFIEAREKES